MKTTIITLVLVTVFQTSFLFAANPEGYCSRNEANAYCICLSLSEICITSLAPAAPLEASFEDAENIAFDTYNMKTLEPVAPAVADFDDSVPGPSLKPEVPVMADFNDSTEELPSVIISSTPVEPAVTSFK